ncbi:sodium-dependent transporter [Boudabousia tangfeifanii]|uniref:Sodium-dependent transporter n=1 Tax=Boudabousia tangfeifanii TaxID=1912795 RepID=A0A1D9MHZ7_9ACTO|nr:sodium-dependent transporter [Boudabousia tangfeifanii]AOZ71914.1 sodium-dependent transporter [Boudabousia tangfeifanii]
MDTTKQTTEASASRETWSSQTGFLLAAIGSAIGLGNIWRFPGIAYKNGGGAFLIPYIVALFAAGVSFLLLDYALGHRLRGAAPTVFRRIHHRAEILGWFKVAISFIITCYYAVIIAWALRYAIFSLTLAWGDDPASFFIKDFLGGGNPSPATELHFSPVWGVFAPLLIVWVVILGIVALGVQRGLEKANKVVIPALVVLFGAVVIRAVTLPGATDGLNAFFTPNWSALSDGGVWIAAFSQIFYSLSIGFGIMVTYASYLPRRTNLGGTAYVAAFANSSFEILAGIGVFSALGFMAFKQGVAIGDLQGITGVSLSFISFPMIISKMPGGAIFGFLFFTSLVLAGMTSLMSLIQVVSGAFQEKFNWRPVRASITIGVPAALVSLLLFSTTSGLNTLDVVDKYTNEIGVVLCAISTAVLVTVIHPRLSRLRRHINVLSNVHIGKWWDLMVGFVVPAALLWMLIQTAVSLIKDGYDAYPGWYTAWFGWGAIVFALISAYILTLTTWRQDVDDFTVMPLPYRPRDRYGRIITSEPKLKLIPTAQKSEGAPVGVREEDDEFEYGDPNAYLDNQVGTNVADGTNTGVQSTANERQ